MAKAKRRPAAVKKEPISGDEKQALRALKLVGHEFAIGQDEHKRDRVVAGGNRRQFDIGSMKSVVRVRNVDPLIGISSLSWQQRKAGQRFREDYEVAERDGVKTGSWDIRVDGGGGDRERPERIAAAHLSLAKASAALGYGEIRRTIEAVCGDGLSIKALSERDRNPREVISTLLGMGLQKLAVHYGIVSQAK